MAIDEPLLLPDLAIVDPHHHFRPSGGTRAPYLVADYLADRTASGHRSGESVFVECSIMYREGGPAERRSLGETAFVAGLAGAPEATAAGIAAGIVARIDLTFGDRVAELVDAHREAAHGRLRGVRDSVAWADLAPFDQRPDRRLLEDVAFRVGAAALAAAGLTLDLSVLHPQLADLAAFARAVPGLTIVCGHLGCPVGEGPDARRMADVFPVWRNAIRDLATCPNVMMKVGGLGQFWERPPTPPTAAELVQSWRPWVETAVAAFGPGRCMVETNMPTNASAGALGPSMTALKHILAPATPDERAALFAGTARRVYRLSAPA